MKSFSRLNDLDLKNSYFLTLKKNKIKYNYLYGRNKTVNSTKLGK